MIIGITGTLCAGKGTIVDYLVKKKGYKHFSVRGYLKKELQKRNIPETIEALVNIANEIRSSHTPSFIAEELIKEGLSSGRNCIIESLRCEAEIKAIKAYKGIIFAVDANIEKRYNRMIQRQEAGDDLSFDEFVESERKQWQSTDPNKQNLKRCIELADYKFNNNGTKKELHHAVEQALSNIHHT